MLWICIRIPKQQLRTECLHLMINSISIMKNKTLLRIVFLLLLAFIATVALRAAAQTGPLSPSPAQNSVLRPPPGAKVALVEFADLQCPDCSRAAPLLEEAAKAYKIPVVVYDFPLPQHSWSFEAAVVAHYLRTKSTKASPLETKYRLFIYENQAAITPQNLRSYIGTFAKENKITIPFAVDPEGKYASEVRRDKDKGISINIQHTPTLYVTTNKSSGIPFVEVVDRGNLFAMIDQAMAETKSEPASTSASASKAKKTRTAKN
jgi:protein-disulfide isomerase